MVPLFWLSVMPVNSVVHVAAACALRDPTKTKRDAAITLATVLARTSLLILCLAPFLSIRVARTTGLTFRFGRGLAEYPFELAALGCKTIGSLSKRGSPSAGRRAARLRGMTRSALRKTRPPADRAAGRNAAAVEAMGAAARRSCLRKPSYEPGDQRGFGDWPRVLGATIEH
jgi:hypothetical protein